ncbi:MAG: hypothetical protein HKM05_04365 [Spirochaetales bacterium]|nr:hypothetical protein [Spirochaetales bacterium]
MTNLFQRRNQRFFAFWGLFGGILLVANPLSAVSVAQISELSGSVTVTRQGSPLAENLQPGTALEDYDLIVTGPQSQLTVIFPTAGGFSGSLRMGPNTALWWQVSSAWGQTAKIFLLRGSMRVNSDPAQTRNHLEVQTARLRLKATKATFWVASDNRNLLAASQDGVITGTFDNLTLFSQPGSALELNGNNFVPVSADPSTLTDFLNQWQEATKRQAQKALVHSFPELARQYLLELGQLNRAEARLRREAIAVLNLWKSQDTAGTVSPLKEAEHEKSLVVGPLLQVQRPLIATLSLNESLKQAWQSERLGNLPEDTAVYYNYTAKDFFERWRQDQNSLSRWTADFCWDSKLFAERNQGKALPQETKSAESIKESDFFN